MTAIKRRPLPDAKGPPSCALFHLDETEEGGERKEAIIRIVNSGEERRMLSYKKGSSGGKGGMYTNVVLLQFAVSEAFLFGG